MQVSFTVELTPAQAERLPAALKMLFSGLDFLGTAKPIAPALDATAPVNPTPAPPVPAAPIAPTAPAAPAPFATAAPTAAPNVPVSPANTTPTTYPSNPAPTSAPAPVAAAPSYELNDLQTAAGALIDAGKQAELAALLPKFGVQRMDFLPPEQYSAFAMALRELGARI